MIVKYFLSNEKNEPFLLGPFFGDKCDKIIERLIEMHKSGLVPITFTISEDMPVAYSMYSTLSEILNEKVYERFLSKLMEVENV